MPEQSHTDYEGAPPPRTSDSAAWAALNTASREKADAFIEEHTILTRLQAKELAHELQLRHWSMRFSNVSSIMKVSFEIAMALIVMFIAALIAGAVWNAAHDDGLVIYAFSVPPDLAARGMTGEVVAGRMLDKLAAMQAQTDSMRTASSYTNNWGDDIKVQIPDTGVSIGEFNRYLHQWLGNQTHISGDIVRTAGGLTVTARAGTQAAESFTGPDGDLDALLQRAAEAVYARTQPYRYAVYLSEHDKLRDGMAIFAANTQRGSNSEQAWAYIGLANGLAQQNQVLEQIKSTQKAAALDPDNALAWYKESQALAARSRYESALSAGRTSMRVLAANGAADIRRDTFPFFRSNVRALTDDLVGDYGDEATQYSDVFSTTGLRVVQEGAIYLQATALAEDHDLAEAHWLIAHSSGLSTASTLGQADGIAKELTEQNVRGVEMFGAIAQKDWARLLETARALDAEEPKLDSKSVADFFPPTQIWPWLAYAEAMTGDFRAAHRDIDKTPFDCDLCVQLRGDIDAAEKNWNGASFWFTEAVRRAPSIPFADTDWGTMLLARGDYDGAIAKFHEANVKGPHFADPLEMWGEALMQQNRSDLALAKFEEANKYAPNWGRLHLEWGKALFYLAHKDDAQKQFALASNLDLSAGDRAALVVWGVRK